MSGSATRVHYADFIDYPSDGETESGGVVYATTGAGKRTAPPSADWTASTTSVNGGIAKWSNFVYYNVGDKVFATGASGQNTYTCAVANINTTPQGSPSWTAGP